MNRTMPYRVDYIEKASIVIFTAVAAYFNSTLTFLGALMLAFLFNILAGFKADDVKFTLRRVFPPLYLRNFQGNKLKDSLAELLIITIITYVLKSLTELMKYEVQAVYVVQFLMAIAIYYYFRNALKNLKIVYPRVRFISVVYHLISFKFRQLLGDDIADIVDKEERRDTMRNIKKSVKRNVKNASEAINKSKKNIDNLKDEL